MESLDSVIAGTSHEMRERMRGHIRSLRTLLVKDGDGIGPADLQQESRESWETITGALNLLLNRSENSAVSLSIQKAVMLLKNSDFHGLISAAAGAKKMFGEEQAAAWLKVIMDTELAK